MKPLIILALLLVGCETGPSYKTTTDTYYRLGREAMLNAVMSLELRKILTDQEWTLDEARRYSDSVAQMGEFQK